MAQHDYNIANAAAASVRADINNALSAILTLNSGATAPSTTQPGMLYYNTSSGIMQQRNSSDSGWATLYNINAQGLLDQKGGSIYATTGGSANTYTATQGPGPISLSAGQLCNLNIHATNTGASTLNLNGLGATAIVKNGGEAVRAGDLSAGSIVSLIYTGSLWHVVGVRNALDINGIGGSPPRWTSVSQVTIPTGCWANDTTGSRRIQATSDLVVSLAAGGVNGLDTGTEASATKYYLWLAQGASGVCGLLSISPTAPTLPSGYNSFSALLPVLVYNNASSDILNFDVHSWTIGNAEVAYKSLTGATVSTTFNPGGAWTTLSVNTFLPAFADLVRLNISTPNACTMLFSTAGATFGTEFQVGVGANFLLPTPFIALNGSLQIQAQSNVSQNHTVYVAGYRSISW